jgi:predicted RNA-binding protein (virulence factor B family)
MPYHDKSKPDEIYDIFGLSKKEFKRQIGHLYKEKKIQIKEDGIYLV